MSAWATLPLGQVVTFQRGYDLPHRARKSGEIPIVSSAGVTDFHDVAMVDPPGVVTGRYGRNAYDRHMECVESGRRREEYAAIAQDLTEAGYSDADASRAVIVLVAARTQIGCLINSEWRKHPI